MLLFCFVAFLQDFHAAAVLPADQPVIIKHQGAFWEHMHWGWPGTVMVNAAEWNPAEKNFLTTTGAVAFLPERYSLAAVSLEVIEGRDLIARIVHRSGRDLATLWADDEAV